MNKEAALLSRLKSISRKHWDILDSLKEQIEELDRSYGNGHIIEAIEDVMAVVRRAKAEVYDIARLKPRPTV